ncbi:MAG: hypothetical protein OSA39_12605 [Sphingobium sp.]|jgi:hypothetical protein|nr:hypothetical protein [Sphingobium sp.]|tara:strand:- start:10745 stop:10888 length:144 start_codon:yes stop_codon:yes gene_type:complete
MKRPDRENTIRALFIWLRFLMIAIGQKVQGPLFPAIGRPHPDLLKPL